MIRDQAKALFLASMMLALGALVGAAPALAERAASMVIDGNTGAVLHEEFADAPRHPASLTKIMTIFLAFREIENGRLSFSSKLKMSKRAASVAPSKLNLEPGAEIALGDAIKALIVKSANDVAVALAERIAGSEPAFARLMNKTAAEIGMRSTTFYNASGLPDKRQITTARDMLTLALRLQDEFPQHYGLFKLKTFKFRGKTYRTHNTLLHGFPGMDGMKTGYIRASGFNVVSSVRTEKKHVVAVVFGGATAAARNSHMRLILYRALEKASTERTRKPNTAPPRRRAPQPEQVATGLSAMPRGEESESEPLIAARNQPRQQAPEANWRTETKSSPRAPAPKEARSAAAPKQKNAPQPVRASKDEIADVLARAEATPRIRPVTTMSINLKPAGDDTLPQPSAPPEAPPEVAAPRLDLAALRKAMSNSEELPHHSSAALGPARPPSTLDAQAEALASMDNAPRPARGTIFARAEAFPSRLQGPSEAMPNPVTPQGSGFEIQVGAYGTVEEAQARIVYARKRAPGLLENHDHVTMAVQNENRQIYRARFINFSEDAAQAACQELRRLAIDCFAMKSARQ